MNPEMKSGTFLVDKPWDSERQNSMKWIMKIYIHKDMLQIYSTVDIVYISV